MKYPFRNKWFLIIFSVILMLIIGFLLIYFGVVSFFKEPVEQIPLIPIEEEQEKVMKKERIIF